MLVARPAATFPSLIGSGLSWRRRHMVARVGLRGQPRSSSPPSARRRPRHLGVIFNTVFVAVITSVLVQGPTVSLVARRLGIAEPVTEPLRSPIDVDLPRDPTFSVKRLQIEAGSEADGTKLLAIGGPDRPLIVLIRRQGCLFLPTGASPLAAGDELFALGSDESMQALGQILRKPRIP